MKVFAEYIQKNNRKYRKKTLLQFGDSINLIGSAVLVNPGSAIPIKNNNFNVKVIREFYSEIHKIRIENMDIWYQFTTDVTMRYLEKIFNGWYIGKNKELNGIIQLFNCSYYKEQNLNDAIRQFSKDSAYLFNEGKLFKEKPVYFGWGNEGKSGVFKEIAEDIFSKYLTINVTHIYNPVFLDNCFYHPRTINIHYKENEVKIFLKKFYKLMK